MLSFGMTIPATVPQRSEIPEGLTNYPACEAHKSTDKTASYFFQPLEVWVHSQHSLYQIGVTHKVTVFLSWILATHYSISTMYSSGIFHDMCTRTDSHLFMPDPAYDWSHSKICFLVVKNWTVNSLNCVDTICRVQLKCDGTQWRMGGEVKGKLANGMGGQYSHTTSEHGVSSISTADAHTSAASSRLNWCPRRFKGTRPFRRKTKSGFCMCAITF
jgi:hypothetical protein